MKKYDQILKELSSSSNRADKFREVEINEQGSILMSCSRLIRRRILSEINNDEILDLIKYLDPDDATDMLQNLSPKRRKKIVEHMDLDTKDKVEFLLKFDPRTAAGIMSLDYITVQNGSKFSDAFKLIKKHEIRTGRSPAILVVEAGFLIGEIPWRVLIQRKQTEKINKYVKKAQTTRFDREEADVVKRFKNHPHNKIVVLDEDNSILGVIYSDDVLRIIEKSDSSDLYDFAGVQEEESVHDGVFMKVKHRYKWLILNLFTGFMVAGVVSIFQETIAAFVLLAAYMPIVAGMGGNAGTQTLAVTVRGLTLKEIELKTGKKAIINEVLAGGLNGSIVGAIVAVIASLLNHNPLLGVAIGMSMVINLMIAGFFGATVPLIMKVFNKDPATSATVFITTATDMCGFFVFLGLASLVI